MEGFLAHGWRFCIATLVLCSLAGCSAGVRRGMLDGYDHAYASPCGAAFIGYHGRESCFED